MDKQTVILQTNEDGRIICGLFQISSRMGFQRRICCFSQMKLCRSMGISVLAPPPPTTTNPHPPPPHTHTHTYFERERERERERGGGGGALSVAPCNYSCDENGMCNTALRVPYNKLYDCAPRPPPCTLSLSLTHTHTHARARACARTHALSPKMTMTHTANQLVL